MKASDRSVLLGLVILGLLACFWFLLLAPKREQASELGTQVTELQAEVAEQEQLAAAAELAQADYAKNYERLVVLGEAAPADGDTPSLLAQLSSLAERSKTEFGSLTVSGDAPAAAPAASQTTTDQNAEAGTPTSATPPTGSPAPATEASAALLPLGATVGPAGLGVIPYELHFTGDFFGIADLLEGLDAQIAVGKQTKVDGRLLTVNGLIMERDPDSGQLLVDLTISSYVLPESQGLTAGGTPVAPPASVPPATAVPTSTPATP